MGFVQTRVGQNALVIGAVLLIQIFAHTTQDRIAVANGFGYDGTTYGALARDFGKQLADKEISRYRIQRVLPPAVVHYSLKALSLPRTDQNVIGAFRLLNVILLTLSAGLWCLVAERLGLGSPGKFFGAVALFGSLAVLKVPAYYPVLTDSTAFACGLAMLYAYLCGRTSWLLVLTGLGAFIWPTILPVGAVLVLFPRRPEDATDKPAPRYLNIVVAIAATAAVAAVLYVCRSNPFFRLEFGANPPIQWWPSAAIVILFVLFGLRVLCDQAALFQPRRYLAGILSPRCLFLVLLVGAVYCLQHTLASSVPTSEPTLKKFVRISILTGTAKPGVFLVAHAVYFGPIVLLALLHWRETCRRIHAQGLGLTMVAIVGLLMAVNSESRCLSNLLPLFAPFVIQAVAPRRWLPATGWGFALLTLLYSRLWMTWSPDPGTGNLSFRPDDLASYAAQTYFMNYGPWMAWWSYGVQAVAVFATGVWLFFTWPRSQQTGAIHGQSTDAVESDQPPSAIAA